MTRPYVAGEVRIHFDPSNPEARDLAIESGRRLQSKNGLVAVSEDIEVGRQVTQEAVMAVTRTDDVITFAEFAFDPNKETATRFGMAVFLSGAMYGTKKFLSPDTGGGGGIPHQSTAGAPKRIAGSSDAEHAIDELLRSQGRRVEGNVLEGVEGAGRQGDRLIDGVLTEYKTISGVADKTADGLSGAIARRVMDGRGQAAHIIVDARSQPGMTQAIAERGIIRAFGADNRTGSKIQSIQVIGNGFDITVPRAN